MKIWENPYFPKPEYLPIEDWFDATRNTGDMSTLLVTERFTAYEKNRSGAAELLFVRAAKEIIDLQINAGISITPDGEVRREYYIGYKCCHFDGFDYKNLEHRILRDGAYENNIPVIRSTVRNLVVGYVAHNYTAIQSVSSDSVKFTLPGPLTIMNTTVDCFCDGRQKLNRELADTVNKEILALVDAGRCHVQVDKPLFARPVLVAFDFGIDGLERCFYNVPDAVTKIVQMCCGYLDHLDDEDYKKADPDSYRQLASHIDAIEIDRLFIEGAHCCNQFTLLESYKNASIIFWISGARVQLCRNN